MEVLSSVVLWRNESLNHIRRMVDSSLCIASASAELGIEVAFRSILCAIQPNEAQPDVHEWARDFKLRCAKFGKIDAGGRDRPRAEFELISVDPSQALSGNLNHILAFALANIFTGSAILHEIPFDSHLARQILKTLLPMDFTKCCLVSVRSSHSKRARLAYLPSVDDYARNGLFDFERKHYFRKHGFFRKPTYGIKDLDDLVSAMEKVAADHRWTVKQLELPVLANS